MENETGARREDADSDAWDLFRDTQKEIHKTIGCVSQPAHAALAGRIAQALNPAGFGPIPEEVHDVIAKHDVGWAAADLAALESWHRAPPVSFLAYPADRAVDVWRQSIRAAEKRSLLAGILTSRHFCLLAPEDDAVHLSFREEETKVRAQKERDCSVPADDLDRYTSALGFCDLLSLYLCSGSREAARFPLAHPADPTSKTKEHVSIDAGDSDAVRGDKPIFNPGISLHVQWWKRAEDAHVHSQITEWRLG